MMNRVTWAVLVPKSFWSGQVPLKSSRRVLSWLDPRVEGRSLSAIRTVAAAGRILLEASGSMRAIPHDRRVLLGPGSTSGMPREARSVDGVAA